MENWHTWVAEQFDGGALHVTTTDDGWTYTLDDDEVATVDRNGPTAYVRLDEASETAPHVPIETIEREVVLAIQRLYDNVPEEGIVSTITWDDAHSVSLNRIDEQTGKEMPRSGWTATCRHDGTIEEIVEASTTQTFVPIDYVRTPEQLHDAYLEVLPLPLRYARFEGRDQYVGGDGSYRLVYDTMEGDVWIEPDGSFTVLEESDVHEVFIGSEQMMDQEAWDEWTDRTAEWVNRMIGPMTLQWNRVTEDPVSGTVIVSFIRTEGPYEVGEPSSVTWKRDRGVVVEAQLDRGLYAVVEPATPVVSRDEARRLLAQQTVFDYAPEVYEDDDEGHITYVRGISQQYPATHGNVHAIEAATGKPWLVDTSSIRERRIRLDKE